MSDKDELMYALDIPDHTDPEGPWVNIGYYATRDEALADAKRLFEADDEGRIELVSEIVG